MRITQTEKYIDRYYQGLKTFIWRELGTKEYPSLSKLMKDVDRIETVYRRFNNMSPKVVNSKKEAQPRTKGPASIDTGNIQLKKFTEPKCD